MKLAQDRVQWQALVFAVLNLLHQLTVTVLFISTHFNCTNLRLGEQKYFIYA